MTLPIACWSRRGVRAQLGNCAGLFAALAACSSPAGERTDARIEDPPAVIRLVDISDQSPALALSPYAGAAGWDQSDKYAPGVALVDLDGDGALDLVQPRNDRADPDARALRLYRGLGDGRFEPVDAIEWDDRLNATAVLAFDYDGDDDLDLFVAVDGGPSKLYRNDGAWQFTSMAEAAGVALIGARAFAVAAADYDADGDLDLYVGTWNASAADKGADSAPNILMRNNGDGTFSDATEGAGVACYGRSTLGLGFADFDRDGDQDLYVANDFFDACLYENLGDGTFRDVADAAGVAAGAWHGMGVGLGDLDSDGDLDLLITDDQWPDESRGNAVYLNRGDGTLSFDSRAIELGLDGVSTLQADWLVCWGVGLIDFDLDGDLDVHVTTHGGRSELLWQQVDGQFVAQYALMSSLADVDGRGSAYGDIDGDGDLDMVIGRRGAGVQVMRNDSDTGHWLRVAPRPLAAAPGAIVTVTAGGRTQMAAIQAGSSYMSAQQPTVTFGLGSETRVDRVVVEFSDGTRRAATDVAVDQQLRVDR